MKKLCMMMLAFCAAVSAAYGGATYYFKAGATDFTDSSNYSTNSTGTPAATSLPGAEDQIILPDATTFSIAGDSESFTVLSGVKRIRPRATSVLEFTIADGSTKTLNAAVNFNADSRSYDHESEITHAGKIVKKGGGTLVLAASGTMKYGIKYNQDYFTAFDLREGTLKFPQRAIGAMYFGDVTMSEEATLVTCGNITNSSLATPTYVRSINGYGTITNESGRTAGQTFSPYARDVVCASEFHGKLCYPARYWLDGRLVQHGHETGIGNLSVTVQYNYGHLNDGYDRGVYSFEDMALLGSSAYVQIYSQGGGIHYFGGEDAEMSKTFNLYSYNYPAFIDAGWHGGIRSTGSWSVKADNASMAVQKWLVLTGSNTVPCTIEGAFVESDFSGKDWASTIPYTIVVQKLGSGTWRFKKNRSHAGGFAIEEGTLQFDSIAEKGVASSLGLSTNLTEIGSTKNPGAVPYAFLLGSTNASAPAAVFEFTGPKSSQSSTRPLALKGDGGTIKASGTDGARLGFGGVSALAAGETTLVLDGTNTQSNVATGITDGNGVVSVVKDGSGDWYLSGTNTFSGDLLVKSGTLTVQGPKYTWFRFTVKEVGGNTSYLQFRQLALFDADGIRQNICLDVKPPTSTKYIRASNSEVLYLPDSDWMALEPGSFAFGSGSFLCRYLINSSTTYVDQIFSDVGNTANPAITRFDGESSNGKAFQTEIYKIPASGTSVTAQKFIGTTDGPDSWIPFVMRLTNGAPEVVRYDIEAFDNAATKNSWPKVASMEASVDGIHWDLVETNATGEVLAEHEYDFSIPLFTTSPLDDATNGNRNRWFADGTKQVNWDPETGTTPRPGAGFPMRSRADMPTPLANVRSVSVAAGATLKTYDGVEISSLKVDSAGAGTIDGFTFAENGTIDVTNPPDDSSFLPGTYVNCSGLENVSGWTLKVNGTANAKCKVIVRNGKLYFARLGFVVTFR